MPDGFDRLRRAASASRTPFLAWPGERGKDLELEAASTGDPALLARGAEYLDQGGIENLRALLRSLSDGIRATTYGAEPPAEVTQHGIHLPGRAAPVSLEEWLEGRRAGRPAVAIAFYRARGRGLHAAMAAGVVYGIAGGFRQDLLLLLGPVWLWCMWPLGARSAGTPPGPRWPRDTPSQRRTAALGARTR